MSLSLGDGKSVQNDPAKHLQVDLERVMFSSVSGKIAMVSISEDGAATVPQLHSVQENVEDLGGAISPTGAAPTKTEGIQEVEAAKTSPRTTVPTPVISPSQTGRPLSEHVAKDLDEGLSPAFVLDASASSSNESPSSAANTATSKSNDLKTTTDRYETRPQPSDSSSWGHGSSSDEAEVPISNRSDNNKGNMDKKNNKRTRRSYNVSASQKHTQTMGSSLFPKPCMTHKPTLKELKSMSFSSYIRRVVLYRALPQFEDLDGEDRYDDDNWCKTPMPLTEGIAKVSLPEGFWKEKGIGNDRTARGPAWQPGTPLGDKILESPITQHIRGMAGVYEYTFTDNSAMTVAEFRDKADKYRESQVGSAYEDGEEDEEGGNESADRTLRQKGDSGEETDDKVSKENNRIIQLDRHFWKRLGPTMPAAMYGADQEGTFFGDDPASGWSLGNLDSCLHVLGRVPGVTTPYLYAGMWASVFAAHTEDMNLLSINYLHAGSPKIWYAIAPGPDSRRFEALCEFQYASAARSCKEFMRHKRYLLSPMILQKAGIKYTTAIQRPGDAIITFPGGYHFGFNSGFNIAEATNFGVPEWIPYGLQARVCLCRPDSVRIDMQKLICTLELFEADKARRPGLSWKEWGRRRELERLKAEEKKYKNKGAASAKNVLAFDPKVKAKNRKLMSEQEKKNEFWIEVVKPAPKLTAPKPKPVVEETGRGKRKRTKTTKASMWEMEGKRPEPAPAVVAKEIWHLAKPIGKKGVEVGARILCLLPATVMTAVGDSKMPDGEVEEDQCFAGIVSETSEDFARIHLAGLPKTEDVWVPLAGNKLFLDGGRYVEDEGQLPKLHYWKEMDSKCRCGGND